MQEYFKYYQEVLRQQLIPATGCTEPIALAYAAALAKKALQAQPEQITATVSGSIVKNVKSVVVPMTDGMKGIEVAVAAGVVAGNADRELEVLADAPADTPARIEAFLKECPVKVELSKTGRVFDIEITAKGAGHTSYVRIADKHTNVVSVKRDDQVMQEKELEELGADNEELLDVKKIYTFAQECRLEDVAPVIENQIACNTRLSKEGLDNAWGAEIGRTLLKSMAEPDVKLRAMAEAAAGSDARMSGCDLPAVINSGSGNQGMTITMPVVVYAKEWNVSHEKLVRALVLANLIAVRIKQSIGYLSAYCGAICAGCAAAAGVAYLDGASEPVIEQTVINGLAVLSGTICDGAKPSCAAKIAMAVNSGLLAYAMAKDGKAFKAGEGIIKEGIENTIEKVGILGREGMGVTNDVILNIMVNG